MTLLAHALKEYHAAKNLKTMERHENAKTAPLGMWKIPVYVFGILLCGRFGLPFHVSYAVSSR